MRRDPGTGSITELSPTRHWVRLTDASGRRRSLGVYPSHAKAERVLAAAVRKLHEVGMAATGAPTWAAYAERWSDDLYRVKSRSALPYSSRVRRVADADWTRLPLRGVTRRDIEQWIASRLMSRDHSRPTIAADLFVARRVFDLARRDGLTDANPCADVEPPRALVTEDAERYLTLPEQRLLLSHRGIEEDDRLCVAFALGTGIRRGELIALELPDVDLQAARIQVRYGGPNHAPTKAGKPRWVPLFGFALAAAKAWLPRLKGRLNHYGVMWPGALGGYRKYWFLEDWPRIRAKVGLDEVRWHDLRHTCASSLLSGLWGPSWSMQEVSAMLGHASIRETERYAKFTVSALDRAAERMRNLGPTVTASKLAGFLAP